MNNMLKIIVVAYRRPIRLRILIDCFLMQTCGDWEMHIIHDGVPPQSIMNVISLYDDPRITFEHTPQVNGKWGHPNRNMGLSRIPLSYRNFVLMTNDDNYYVPDFVRLFALQMKRNSTGMVYCDTLHNYQEYDVLHSQPKKNYIDMGSFAVRVDVAKKVGFNNFEFAADGDYAEKCANLCSIRRLRVAYIRKALFVHN